MLWIFYRGRTAEVKQVEQNKSFLSEEGTQLTANSSD